MEEKKKQAQLLKEEYQQKRRETAAKVASRTKQARAAPSKTKEKESKAEKKTATKSKKPVVEESNPEPMSDVTVTAVDAVKPVKCKFCKRKLDEANKHVFQVFNDKT